MSDRNTMLQEISEVSFMVNDLALYLDTHPLDPQGLEAFSQAAAKRKQLLEDYARIFEPLTMNCVCPDTAVHLPVIPAKNILLGAMGHFPGIIRLRDKQGGV